ncbi:MULTISPECIES: hypothetical protein [unclassified Herbaspirillum]|uniref:hypothetical protein n=1 Tax=unclassified Herbaspirillum TaxID=2624150 RepID=UPI001150B58F|nr:MULTISPECIES: hypothetical protein [unclassified Herbaspirillum]MBB5392780.1 hypothetical protein [Herbaspirillum sp. SJZ102]TQK04572.1 hypothetical protein FB599_3136 [Herbaspirillum sp. SJZ130]TQK09642.1 hypothetical protein FB598_2625 [Herbaspirillum sp. SJZ106]
MSLTTVHWGKYQGYLTATVRDGAGKTIPVFTDYLDYLVETHFKGRKSTSASKSEMEPCVYVLNALAQFLFEEKLPLAKFNDSALERFRDNQFEVVKNNPRSRAQQTSWYQTVNRQLTIIYEFLNWSQSEALLPPYTIGNADVALITSTLPRLITGGTNTDNTAVRKYPLRYKRKAAGKTKALQHWATDDELIAIDDHFWSRENVTISTRNSMMLTIMDTLGLRISSTNSLTTNQFSAEALARREDSDTYIVVPPFQKGELDFPFPVPWELAHAIRAYCEDDSSGRKAILRKTGANESIAKHAVFLSLKTGAPLSTHTWVRIFSKAFKAAGAPIGAASHSIRRKFLDDQFVAELEYRLAINFPITYQEVAAAVQEKAGHLSMGSQKSYLRAITRVRNGSQGEKLSRQVQQMKVEKHELLTANANLRAQLKAEREVISQMRKAIELAQSAPSLTTSRKKKDIPTIS